MKNGKKHKNGWLYITRTLWCIGNHVRLMMYTIVYEGVTFTIDDCESVVFKQTSSGLEAILSGTNPSITLLNTLEFLQENGLITSLNLSEEDFAFRVVDGFVKA